jgi:hypothetical protein
MSKRKRKKKPRIRDEIIRRPECGAVMVLRITTRYKYPSGEFRKFYGCSRLFAL